MKTTFFFLTIFLNSYLLLQAQTPDSVYFADTFRGKPVIAYHTPKADSEQLKLKQLYIQQGIDTVITSRNNALTFFSTMSLLAEPTTISFKFTDYTYSINRHDQKLPYILNADICTPIPIGGKKWKYNTLQILPQFKVRIFANDTMNHDDRSQPVRTPSYLPGITYYFSCKKRFHVNDAAGVHGWYFGLRAFHHSNGQDGEEYNADGSLNVYNGDFGEQLVGEGIIGYVREYNNFRKGFVYTQVNRKNARSRSQLGRTLLPNRLWYARASFEWHQIGWATNQHYRRYTLYGQNRLNFQFGHIWNTITRDLIYSEKKDAYYAITPAQIKERFRFILSGMYILDQYYRTGNQVQNSVVSFFNFKRLNLTATGFYRIPGAPMAGVFTQLVWYGSDPYNVYFQQSMLQVRFGLAMAFFKYPKSPDLSATNNK
jgi:hypothetical protein